MDKIPQHVEISVNAVGGIESERGKEMFRVLMERENPKSEPIPALPAPSAPQEPDVLGDEIGGLLQRINEAERVSD